ncbi:MAG: DUF2147 domain-containing protein [Pseudomonadota bacterium]
MALSPNVAAQPNTAESAAPEVGIWYDDTGKGAVEIAPCGSQFCGHIVWLSDPNHENGQPLKDVYNPEPTRRNQPICGLQVLGKLTRQSDGSLDSGWVYDPKVGKAYNAEVRTVGNSQLAVRGYLSLKLLGKTLMWQRAPDNLERCDAPVAARAG